MLADGRERLLPAPAPEGLRQYAEGQERTIQVQFISLVSTSRMLPKSKSRYIQ